MGRQIPDIKLDMGLGFQKLLEVYDYTVFSESTLYSSFVVPAEDKPKNAVREIIGKRMTDKFSMYLLCGDAAFPMQEMGRKNAVAIVTGGSGLICGSKAIKGERFLITNETIKTVGDEDFEIILCI